jgi:hypothetical protein
MPYELMEEEPESLGQQGLRHGARTLSNIGTRAIGLPGDIFSLINQFIAKPATESLSGEEGVAYEETLLGKILPTTETHRKGLEEVTGEYLKPQNKIEKFADNIIEDASLLINPSRLVTEGVKKVPLFVKSLAKSLGANVAGESLKEFGAGETAGDLTKIGSLFLLSVLDKESAAKQVAKLYGQAESKLPKDAKVSAKSLEKNINSLETQITKGRPRENLSAPEKFVIDQIDKSRRLIKDGSINVEQAIAQKRSLYKDLTTLYKEVPKKTEQKTVKNLAKKVGNYLNQTVKEYGKDNTNFYKDYKNADEAFGTLARSNFVSSWIENNIVQHPLTTGLLHILGTPLGTTVGVATGAILPYQGMKLMYRITKSPTLRNIYGKTLKAAAKEDVPLFNKYLKDLDSGLQEEENKDKFEFLD